jgi:hypothetical protein
MRIEFQLRRLLIEYNLDRHGVIQDIADATSVNRQTIAKLYHGTGDKVSLGVIERLVEWLVKNGVEAEDLPSRLIGAVPELWDRIRMSRKVRLYVGALNAEGQIAEHLPPLIPQGDSAVVARLVEKLSECDPAPGFEIENVPFRTPVEASAIPPSEYPHDLGRRRASYDDRLIDPGLLFKQMRSDERSCTSFVVGSQKVNTLLEYLVADTFSCEPFKSRAHGRPVVPFYVLYRRRDPNVISCFGGREGPEGVSPDSAPGVYMLDDNGSWQRFPARDRGTKDVCEETSVGVIVTIYRKPTESLEIALFGFSGNATEAIGRHFINHTTAFWPSEAPGADGSGTEHNRPGWSRRAPDYRLGVFVCPTKETLIKSGERIQSRHTVQGVVPLSQWTLREFAPALRRPRPRSLE